MQGACRGRTGGQVQAQSSGHHAITQVVWNQGIRYWRRMQIRHLTDRVGHEQWDGLVGASAAAPLSVAPLAGAPDAGGPAGRRGELRSRAGCWGRSTSSSAWRTSCRCGARGPVVAGGQRAVKAGQEAGSAARRPRRSAPHPAAGASSPCAGPLACLEAALGLVAGQLALCLGPAVKAGQLALVGTPSHLASGCHPSTSSRPLPRWGMQPSVLVQPVAVAPAPGVARWVGGTGRAQLAWLTPRRHAHPRRGHNTNSARTRSCHCAQKRAAGSGKRGRRQ